MLRLAQPFADHHINIFHFDPNGSGVHHRDPFYKLVGNRIIIFRKAQRLLLQPRLHLPLSGGPETPPAFIFFKSLHLIQNILFLHRHCLELGVQFQAVHFLQHLIQQEEDDASWIFGDAIAAGSASVDKNSCLRDEAVACDQAYVTQRSALSGHARAEDSVYIRGAVLSEEARAAGTAMVLDVKDKGKFPKLSGQCIVYGTVAGAVEVTGAAVILWEEKIRNDTPDTLILDGQSRSILRDPARDELKPSHSPKRQERTPKRKELDR